MPPLFYMGVKLGLYIKRRTQAENAGDREQREIRGSVREEMIKR